MYWKCCTDYTAVLRRSVWRLCCGWTGENEVLGDRFIHDRDLEWLRQSDGEVPVATYWSFLTSPVHWAGVTSDLWMCVFSCRCRGNTAFSWGRLWAGTRRGHEEESFLPFQTIGKTWGHFLFRKDQRHKHKGFWFICFVIAGLSAMIRGAEDGDSFVVRDYAEEDIEKILDEFFSNLKSPKMWQFWPLLANWEPTES